MNSSGGGEHEPSSTEKGLKMKIKRTKNIGQGPKTEGPTVSKHEIVKGAASNSGNCGNSTASLHDSNSSSSVTGSNSVTLSSSCVSQASSSASSVMASSTTTTVTASSTASKMAMHSPFEKLKQAIFEQEKSKQAKQQQQKQEACKEKAKAESGGLRDSGYSHNSVAFSRGLGGGGGGSMAGDTTSSSIVSSGFAASLKQQKSDPYEFNAKIEDRQGNAALPSAAKKMKTEKEKPGDMRDAMTDTSHVCVMTDPDCLGPCEPGTSVILEGIVWQETENGLLVVNVTWRGKTYVGTLLDATKHEWAPPSFRSDSPQDPDARTPRGGRGKRGRTTMNSMGGRGTRTTRNSSSQQSYNPPPSPAKNNSCPLPTAGEKRRPEGTTPSDLASPAKKPRFEISEALIKPNVSHEWFVCSHPDCNKRYKDVHALKFHQNSAHKDLLLQVEQTSEHNKTHVRFAGMQQTTAAQTDEKPKERRNKKKKNKKNRPDQQQQQQMEVEETNNEGVNNTSNTSVSVKIEPTEASVQHPVTHSNSSPEVPRKQAAMPIQVASMAVQQPGANQNPRTVTAPIVSVPVGSQSSPPSGSKTEGGASGGPQLSKEEKEKKREKKKKKKEKKEKKLLEQQLQKDGASGQSGGQQRGENSTGESKSSPTSGNGAQARTIGSATTMQQRTDKLKDSAIPENVHSPAYSDISDEGNDNVPVLENEVELAKKQSQTIQGTGPKESSGETAPKTSQQEPPNLTPVITHTGHSKPGPPGSMPPQQQPQQQQQQAFPNKDVPRPTNLSIRNTAAPQQVPPSNPEMARQKEAAFSGGRENMKPQSANEMQQGRPNLTQKHPVFGNFPPGYNFSQNPGNNVKPNQSSQAQDRLTPQKVLEEKLRRPPQSGEQINQGPPLNGPQKPQNPGIMERMERHSDMARRNVDSNMNMPHKVPGAGSTNSPQMSRPNNLNMSPGSDLSKQVPPHSSKSDVPKANSVEQHYKQIPGGMSISERQSENEKILKENLELKSQMNVSDKEKAAIDASMRQKDMHRLFLMQHQHQQAIQQQQQQQQQQQRHLDYPRRFEHPQNRDKVKLPGEPQESPKNQPVSSHPMPPHGNPHPGVSRRENSPMPSPKTKAELKQGADRKDLHPSQSFGSGKPVDHRPVDLQRQQMERGVERMQERHAGEHQPVRMMDRQGDRSMDRERNPERSGERRMERPGEVRHGEQRHMDSRHLEQQQHEGRHMDSRHLEQQQHEGRHMDRGPSDSNKRPLGDIKIDLSRKEPPKSPAPAPSMSSPSMSSPAPPPASLPHPPSGSVPHPYPYGYPGYPHGVYPTVPFPMPYPSHPYMPYPDGKTLDILQQQASQFYRDQQREQVRAQDLRKVSDRKSPNPDAVERPKSRHGPPDKRESPNLSRPPTQLPHQHPGPWYNLHNGGGPVPMMQHSPQSSSAKH